MIDKAMIEYFWEMANRNPNHNTNWDDPVVIRFAELIAKYEREACAKEADKRLYDYTMLLSNPPQNGAAWSIANAIRARGEA